MRSIATRVVHAGAEHPEGAVVAPLHASVNYVQEDVSSYDAVRYARLSNTPTHAALHRRIAAIEEAEAATSTASGMAAVASTLLALLRPGDHLLVQDNVYGGTASLLADLAERGITSTTVDAARPETWEVSPRTRVMYVEAIANPRMEVPELGAVVAFCRARGLVSVIDATFVSPVLFQPIPFGFDLALHSATKYLNGHSDVCAGVVVGSASRIEQVAHVRNHYGGSLDAHAAWMLERGLKTLALRVPRQCESAGRIARFLADHKAVARVRYPGLPGDPHHARAARYLRGFGGMLSFDTHDAAGAERALARLRLIMHAASLGGVESLAVRPSRSSHLRLTPEAREALGITDRMIRLSVGIEDADDLIADLEQALAP
ncbi:MAG TPA: PLP-dependent aspartate aminotransferase family protein [Myxococcota bacterium]|nr:PLP-dependent aspartate aminotransferase family protein [Myxococcota bacterium]